MEWTEITLLRYGIELELGHLGDWSSIHGKTGSAVGHCRGQVVKLTS
jgi:hypothetical protein